MKNELDDIERALCLLDGKRFEDIEHIRDIYMNGNFFGEDKITEFFIVRLHKRRTMHFWWRSSELRRRFNALVAKHRPGWVPSKTKRGQYR